MGITEVADDEQVDLKSDAVRNRLDDLEDNGCVHKKRLGHPERGNLAWYLAENERDQPVSSVTMDLYGISSEFIQSGVLLGLGYAVATAGFANIGLGGISKFALFATERRITDTRSLLN